MGAFKTRKNITGEKFGRLTVTGYDHTNKKEAYWHCRCDCGREVVIRGKDLKSGKIQSCGCYKKELNTTHGMSNSKIHGIWSNIKQRCFNPNCKSYKNYGGRGISMYEPWIDNFQAFYDYISQLEHFGEKGFTLDRKDNGGNYEPGNLRWADRKTQQRNKRDNVFVEYNGERMTLAEAVEKSGIPRGTLMNRYYQAGDRGARLFRPIGSK